VLTTCLISIVFEGMPYSGMLLGNEQCGALWERFVVLKDERRLWYTDVDRADWSTRDCRKGFGCTSVGR